MVKKTPKAAPATEPNEVGEEVPAFVKQGWNPPKANISTGEERVNPAEALGSPPESAEEAIKWMAADGAADPEAAARLNWPHLFAERDETPPAAPEEAEKPKRTRKAKPAETQMEAMGVGDNAAKALVSGIERVERLQEEKRALQDDIKEVFGELKANGFDTATIRRLMQRRAMDPDKRREMDDLLETYERAVGLE